MVRAAKGIGQRIGHPGEGGLIRLGISQCLLGAAVRYDGGHKRDPFLVDVLGPHVDWVPVCPELEAGLGVPREPIRLVGSPSSPKVLTINTSRDVSQTLERFSERRVRELDALQLSGYVFKKDSPSCGTERVRLYDERGAATRRGVGVFARAFMTHYPLIPVEEEGRLTEPALRENFIERVFAYRRWQDLTEGHASRADVVDFHTRHKLLLLAHSRTGYDTLGHLVGQAKRYTMTELLRRYGTEFMATLAVNATVRKHVDVLHHIVGHLRSQVDGAGRAELLGLIREYHRGLVPLIVPLTLVNHYVRSVGSAYLREQVYLNPHPRELMLRNHV